MAENKAMAAGDAFFLLIESHKTPSQIGCLMRLKIPEGSDKSFILRLVEGFRKYQPTHAPFNQKLAMRSITRPNYAWKIVDSVDINYHLRHMALPQPGGERELAVLISRLHSIPLDLSRPLWECHVIEGLEDNGFAIYCKIHHALIDGVAATRLMSNWIGQLQPETIEDFKPYWAMPELKRPPKAAKPEVSSEDNSAEASQASAGELLTRIKNSITSAAMSTVGVLSATKECILGARSAKYPGLVAPYSAPYSILNGKVGIQRRVSTVEFDLDHLLKLGKQMGGTLNDVVMTLCGGALRSYLLELKALPETSLIAQVPVSFRPKDDESNGNAIGMVLASIGTDEADPLARFDKIRHSMMAGKALLSSMNAAQIIAYSTLVSWPFAMGQMTGIGINTGRPMYNLVISNVPGPREQRYLNGAEIYSFHPISFIMQGQALNITLFSYNGKLTFVFTACRESLPGVQRMVMHTQQALDSLERAINTASSSITVEEEAMPIQNAGKKQAEKVSS